MERNLITIGGGELRLKSTLGIDAYCAQLAYRHAKDHRPLAVFVPTASHDSKPYFNTFRKTYTTLFDIKADLVLTVRGGEMDTEAMRAKLLSADLIYIGGGDTGFMLQEWRRTGLDKLIRQAYHQGIPVAGLSAGAICWYDLMYTDSAIGGEMGEYHVRKGLHLLRGMMSPHYNLRPEFDQVVLEDGSPAIAVEDNCALHLRDEKIVAVVSTGGHAYRLTPQEDGTLLKEEITMAPVGE